MEVLSLSQKLVNMSHRVTYFHHAAQLFEGHLQALLGIKEQKLDYCIPHPQTAHVNN